MLFSGSGDFTKKRILKLFVEIAEMQVQGKMKRRELEKLESKNPFNTDEIIKIVRLFNKGIATSGNISGVIIFTIQERKN